MNIWANLPRAGPLCQIFHPERQRGVKYRHKGTIPVVNSKYIQAAMNYFDSNRSNSVIFKSMATLDCFEKHPFWDNHLDVTVERRTNARQSRQRHNQYHPMQDNRSLRV